MRWWSPRPERLERGEASTVAGLVAMPDAGPAWYPIALAVTSLPLPWVGGRIGARG